MGPDPKIEVPSLSSTAAATITCFGEPALASEAEVKTCIVSVETAKEMRAESDYGRKELARVDTLIGVSENLCQDEAIDDAERNAAPLHMGTKIGNMRWPKS